MTMGEEGLRERGQDAGGRHTKNVNSSRVSDIRGDMSRS
jgi:hypothetical protein